MSIENTQNDNELSKKGIITLVLSRGLTQLPIAVTGLLLVDIALSFNVEVGIAGQLSTASGLFSIFFGLLMGVLSVRFKHKSLLFTGIMLYVLVAVASYFSTSLSMLIGIFSFVGIANATVIPMVNTLVGELVSPDRRASAIGWTVGGMFLIYLIGMLVIGFIATMGWRMTMVMIIVPVGVSLDKKRVQKIKYH